MATSQIVPFATGAGANVQDLASFIAALSTSQGYTAGVASSQALNRTWRQSSFVAAAGAAWLASLGLDVLDDGNVSALAAKFRQTMGNAANLTGAATSATLLPSSVGQVTVFNGNNVTITMPLAASVPPGSTFPFLSANASGCRVALQGLDVLVSGSSVGSSPLPFGIGDTAVLVSGAAGWYLIGGSLALASSSVFGSSLSADGFQKLPGGTILQRGSGSTSAGAASVAFPTAFPNACRQVIICEAAATGWSSTVFSAVGSYGKTTTGFSARSITYSGGTTSAVAVAFDWLAIGN